MAVTIISQPPGTALSAITDYGTIKQPPVPLSDCWRYCLGADTADGIVSVGSKATVQLTIPGTCTVPTNGTVLKVWGHEFTVNNASDYSATSVRIDAIGLTTIYNLIGMFQANYYFNVATVQTWAIVGPNLVLTLTWLECREQPRFAVDTMVFTAITAAGGSGAYTNGVSPVYKDGFKIATRLGVYKPTTFNNLASLAFKPIAKFTGIEPEKACTSLGTVCQGFEEDGATQIETYLPPLDLTSTEESSDVMQLFALEYGSVSRANCVPVSGTFLKSNVMLGLNAAFDIDDPYQMRRYWPNHPSGLPDGKTVVSFLTTQPTSVPIYADSFAWLYLLTNYQLTPGTHTWKVRFVCYKTDGTLTIVTNNGFTDPAHWWKAHRFDVSPKKVLQLGAGVGITQSNLAYYDVQVIAKKNDLTTSINASEYMRYVAVPSCGAAMTDLYFKVSTGAVGTIAVRVDDVEQTRADVVAVTVPRVCVGTRHEKATRGGTEVVYLRNYKKVQISFTCQNNEEWRRWVQDLQQSTKHWLRVKGNGNDDNNVLGFARKLTIPAGGISTAPYGEGISVVISGYLEDSPIS